MSSMSTKHQHKVIIKALTIGPKTSYDFRTMGCYQSPTRIFELRKLGYDIQTTPVTIQDALGINEAVATMNEQSGLL